MRDFWLVLFASFVLALLVVLLWRRFMHPEILTMPERGRPTPPSLHLALLGLLACVLVAFVANLVMLFKVGTLFSEISANREAESEHQRLVSEMQKRELANHAMILMEQERMLKRLQALAKGE